MLILKIPDTKHSGNLGLSEKTNLRIICTEKGKETQLQSTENAFNKTIEQNFPNLKMKVPTKVKETYRTPNRQGQKMKSSQHTIIKKQKHTEHRKNVNAAREKDEVTYKGKSIRIILDFLMETLKTSKSWTYML